MSQDQHAFQNPSRILSECYILRCLGEFDAEAQKQVLAACPGAPYKTADEALDDWSSCESVTVDHVKWIQGAWQERLKSNLTHDPRKFAAEIAPEIFMESGL